ncbi:hypothetical protein CAOG_05346 [Capsaspora owczarzaki ATCC 30864]|uniref:Uncharacterized protein n=1 Tax=Capsaspora owczarzaki (strain ATCC 30864) TaxID=595528 RepID=A0A0D2WT51_CAPO3|nr:hypothetical protein CAOG_05346 [Capsaspora owczarzaki ATCC 30864]KJE94758.1 hypothetical protein CAOG_005346 [Capsaspora owczarzaki ATCC 30864]|eukprot:XP_004347031.2 hypothetical protein CAOG_05346 [Capsaspora owczarzaki ATCC 30864]
MRLATLLSSRDAHALHELVLPVYARSPPAFRMNLELFDVSPLWSTYYHNQRWDAPKPDGPALMPTTVFDRHLVPLLPAILLVPSVTHNDLERCDSPASSTTTTAAAAAVIPTTTATTTNDAASIASTSTSAQAMSDETPAPQNDSSASAFTQSEAEARAEAAKSQNHNLEEEANSPAQNGDAPSQAENSQPTTSDPNQPASKSEKPAATSTPTTTMTSSKPSVLTADMSPRERLVAFMSQPELIKQVQFLSEDRPQQTKLHGPAVSHALNDHRVLCVNCMMSHIPGGAVLLSDEQDANLVADLASFGASPPRATEWPRYMSCNVSHAIATSLHATMPISSRVPIRDIVFSPIPFPTQTLQGPAFSAPSDTASVSASIPSTTLSPQLSEAAHAFDALQQLHSDPLVAHLREVCATFALGGCNPAQSKQKQYYRVNSSAYRVYEVPRPAPITNPALDVAAMATAILSGMQQGSLVYIVTDSLTEVMEDSPVEEELIRMLSVAPGLPEAQAEYRGNEPRLAMHTLLDSTQPSPLSPLPFLRCVVFSSRVSSKLTRLLVQLGVECVIAPTLNPSPHTLVAMKLFLDRFICDIQCTSFPEAFVQAAHAVENSRPKDSPPDNFSIHLPLPELLLTPVPHLPPSLKQEAQETSVTKSVLGQTAKLRVLIIRLSSVHDATPAQRNVWGGRFQVTFCDAVYKECTAEYLEQQLHAYMPDVLHICYMDAGPIDYRRFSHPLRLSVDLVEVLRRYQQRMEALELQRMGMIVLGCPTLYAVGRAVHRASIVPIVVCFEGSAEPKTSLPQRSRALARVHVLVQRKVTIPLLAPPIGLGDTNVLDRQLQQMANGLFGNASAASSYCGLVGANHRNMQLRIDDPHCQMHILTSSAVDFVPNSRGSGILKQNVNFELPDAYLLFNTEPSTSVHSDLTMVQVISQILSMCARWSPLLGKPSPAPASTPEAHSVLGKPPLTFLLLTKAGYGNSAARQLFSAFSNLGQLPNDLVPVRFRLSTLVQKPATALLRLLQSIGLDVGLRSSSAEDGETFSSAASRIRSRVVLFLEGLDEWLDANPSASSATIWDVLGVQPFFVRIVASVSADFAAGRMSLVRRLLLPPAALPSSLVVLYVVSPSHWSDGGIHRAVNPILGFVQSTPGTSTEAGTSTSDTADIPRWARFEHKLQGSCDPVPQPISHRARWPEELYLQFLRCNPWSEWFLHDPWTAVALFVYLLQPSIGRGIESLQSTAWLGPAHRKVILMTCIRQSACAARAACDAALQVEWSPLEFCEKSVTLLSQLALLMQAVKCSTLPLDSDLTTAMQSLNPTVAKVCSVALAALPELCELLATGVIPGSASGKLLAILYTDPWRTMPLFVHTQHKVLEFADDLLRDALIAEIVVQPTRDADSVTSSAFLPFESIERLALLRPEWVGSRTCFLAMTSDEAFAFRASSIDFLRRVCGDHSSDGHSCETDDEPLTATDTATAGPAVHEQQELSIMREQLETLAQSLALPLKVLRDRVTSVIMSILNWSTGPSAHKFEGLQLEGYDCSHTNLSGACLQNAEFRDCNLSHATLTGAVLDGAKFIGTKISCARTEVQPHWDVMPDPTTTTASNAASKATAPYIVASHVTFRNSALILVSTQGSVVVYDTRQPGLKEVCRVQLPDNVGTVLHVAFQNCECSDTAGMDRCRILLACKSQKLLLVQFARQPVPDAAVMLDIPPTMVAELATMQEHSSSQPSNASPSHQESGLVHLALARDLVHVVMVFYFRTVVIGRLKRTRASFTLDHASVKQFSPAQMARPDCAVASHVRVTGAALSADATTLVVLLHTCCALQFTLSLPAVDEGAVDEGAEDSFPKNDSNSEIGAEFCGLLVSNTALTSASFCTNLQLVASTSSQSLLVFDLCSKDHLLDAAELRDFGNQTESDQQYGIDGVTGLAFSSHLRAVRACSSSAMQSANFFRPVAFPSGFLCTEEKESLQFWRHEPLQRMGTLLLPAGHTGVTSVAIVSHAASFCSDSEPSGEDMVIVCCGTRVVVFPSFEAWLCVSNRISPPSLTTRSAALCLPFMHVSKPRQFPLIQQATAMALSFPSNDAPPILAVAGQGTAIYVQFQSFGITHVNELHAPPGSQVVALSFHAETQELLVSTDSWVLSFRISDWERLYARRTQPWAALALFSEANAQPPPGCPRRAVQGLAQYTLLLTESQFEISPLRSANMLNRALQFPRAACLIVGAPSPIHRAQNSLFAVGYSSGDILLFNLRTQERRGELAVQARHGAVKSMRASDDGVYLAATFETGSVGVWNVPRRTLLSMHRVVSAVTPPSQLFTFDVSFAGGSHYFVVCFHSTESSRVRVLSTMNGACVDMPISLPSPIHATLSMGTSSGAALAVVHVLCLDGSLYVFHLSNLERQLSAPDEHSASRFLSSFRKSRRHHPSEARASCSLVDVMRGVGGWTTTGSQGLENVFVDSPLPSQSLDKSQTRPVDAMDSSNDRSTNVVTLDEPTESEDI